MNRALIFIITLLGCHSRPVTPTPTVITDSDHCGAACDRLRHLGCSEGDDVSVGVQCTSTTDCNAGQQCEGHLCTVTCEKFCQDSEAWGIWLTPICVESITACDQVDLCSIPKGRNHAQ